jgi:DNA-binding beta-propeller fold protein YncE
LSDGQVATTLQGQDIEVNIVNGDVFINNAQVIVADILAENGVVHVIDAVLLPSISVENIEAQNLSIYPCPATENLTVELQSNMENATLRVYNAQGSRMMDQRVIIGKNEIQIADLPSGCYVVEISNNQSVLRRSFVKN